MALLTVFIGILRADRGDVSKSGHNVLVFFVSEYQADPIMMPTMAVDAIPTIREMIMETRSTFS